MGAGAPAKGCRRRLIHRDIKAPNVLLVDDFQLQAWPLLSDGKTEALVNPRIDGDYDGEQAQPVAFLAWLFIHAPVMWRPSITEKMGRELCIADVIVGGLISWNWLHATLRAHPLDLPTWDQMYSKERVSQPNESLRILGAFRKVIFCEDINWDDKEDRRSCHANR